MSSEIMGEWEGRRFYARLPVGERVLTVAKCYRFKSKSVCFVTIMEQIESKSSSRLAIFGVVKIGRDVKQSMVSPLAVTDIGEEVNDEEFAKHALLSYLTMDATSNYIKSARACLKAYLARQQLPKATPKARKQRAKRAPVVKVLKVVEETGSESESFSEESVEEGSPLSRKTRPRRSARKAREFIEELAAPKYKKQRRGLEKTELEVDDHFSDEDDFLYLEGISNWTCEQLAAKLQRHNFVNAAEFVLQSNLCGSFIVSHVKSVGEWIAIASALGARDKDIIVEISNLWPYIEEVLEAERMAYDDEWAKLVKTTSKRRKS